MGKEAIACVPDGFKAVRMGEPHDGDWVMDEHCNALKSSSVLGGIWLIIEPIPAPLSQADVLRDFREMLDAPGDLTIPAEAKTIWCRNIEAVLEAAQNER